MDNGLIPQAIDIVSKAIKADNDKEYERALSLYRDALARFTMGLKYEKNEARKKLILERVEGYMQRAEELSDYLKKQSELENKSGGGVASRAKDGTEKTTMPKRRNCAEPSAEQSFLKSLMSSGMMWLGWITPRKVSRRQSSCQLAFLSFSPENDALSKEFCFTVRRERARVTLLRPWPRKLIQLLFC